MRRIRNTEQISSRFTKELWDSLSKHEIKAIELAYVNGVKSQLKICKRKLIGGLEPQEKY